MNCRAFSLLEILLALAVVSIALLALGNFSADVPKHYASLRDSTYSYWVADNVLTEIKLQNAFPDIGHRQGVQEMGNQQWQWQAVIEQTPNADIRRIEVTVFSETTEQPVLVHNGFAGR